MKYVIICMLIITVAGIYSCQLNAEPKDIQVTFLWTAPGDDGMMGQASTYDLRYNTVSITNANWNSCIQINGEPTPGIAGTEEMFTVTLSLEPGVYYFAIKTADEVPNWSGLSNVVSLTVTDDMPPVSVTDLRIQ